VQRNTDPATDDVLRRVTEVIAETFGVDAGSIGEQTVAEDVPGWDSLSHTILTLALEEAFGVPIPPQSREFANVGELAATLSELIRR